MVTFSMEGSVKSIIQVYTGNGKGKTSAAWGQVLRAAGCGSKVAVIGFLKDKSCSELNIADRLRPDISVFGYISKFDPSKDQRHSRKLMNESQECFKIGSNLIESGKYDLVVLDEINTALNYSFIKEEDVLDTLKNRPTHVDIILTGRYAPESITKAADLVTEMKEIKHPFNSGKKARPGIDY